MGLVQSGNTSAGVRCPPTDRWVQASPGLWQGNLCLWVKYGGLTLSGAKVTDATSLPFRKLCILNWKCYFSHSVSSQVKSLYIYIYIYFVHKCNFYLTGLFVIVFQAHCCLTCVYSHVF